MLCLLNGREELHLLAKLKHLPIYQEGDYRNAPIDATLMRRDKQLEHMTTFVINNAEDVAICCSSVSEIATVAPGLGISEGACDSDCIEWDGISDEENGAVDGAIEAFRTYH